MLRIDRDSPMPLHRQMAEEIRHLILTGEWAVSRRVPSEAELCEQLQLSRNTVRQALQTLEHEGLIVRIAGKGSFVASARESGGLGRFIALVAGYSRGDLPASMYAGIHEIADAHGYQVIAVDPFAGGRGVHAVLDRLEAAGIGNYIIWPEGGEDEAVHLADVVARGQVVVQVDSYLPGLPAAYVGSDHRAGAVLATQHLIDMGHRRIAFLAYASRATSVPERQAGYEAAMRRAGLTPLTPWLMPVNTGAPPPEPGPGSPRFETEQVSFIVSCLLAADRPTAVFAVNDFTAYQLLVAARQLGLRVPEDLAVVGFDDLPFCANLEVPLTSIAQDGRAIGQRACELLLQQAEGRRIEPVSVRLPVRLVPRSSTANCNRDKAGHLAAGHHVI